MSALKHFSSMHFPLVACMVMALVGCGGGGGGGGAGVNSSAISAAAAVPANDTSINQTAGFIAVQNAGIAAVTIHSPPVVNFSVFDHGHVLQGLTLSNVSFVIAKLVPGTGGNPDQWVNYIYRTQSTSGTSNVGSGPGGTAVLASAAQATTDTGGSLSYNTAGYYTYTFGTDITDPSKTNGVIYDPSKTHRVAIVLNYTNAAGNSVHANPYFDFTIDSNGNSLAVTDPSKTRVMVVRAACNKCHDQLTAHGSTGRIDPQLCVLCHNPGTTDPNSGNVLDFKTMIHKIHAGRLLNTSTDGAAYQYVIWGYNNAESDYSNLGFPQDLRNCTKCHNGTASSDPNVAPVTPQGNNWETQASKGACLTCHKTNAWYNQPAHQSLLSLLPLGAQSVDDVADGACKGCHLNGTSLGPAQVHFNQIQVDAAKYQFNFDAPPGYDSTTRTVTITYSITDPTNNNAAYDLKADCSGNCTTSNKFGNVRIVIGSLTLVGAPASIADYTSSSSTNVYAYTGTDDGTHHYTVTTPALPNTGAAQPHGTARALSYGQVIEAQLDPVTRTPVAPPANVNVSLRNQFSDFSLDGTGAVRRVVVSDAQCEACHGRLGTASGSNTVANAFHNGARNSVAACPICHDANRLSSEVNASGVAYNESFQFKRMIHGIHSAGASGETTWSGRANDFIHGDMTAAPPNTGTNYSVVVKYPGILSDCNACHVNNSYQHDGGVLGTNVHTNTSILTADSLNDPLFNNVISPKASSCSGCHDDVVAMSHMVAVGYAVFGTTTAPNSGITCGSIPTSLCGSVAGMLAAGGSANVDWTGGWTQKDILGNQVLEECDGCHAPGAIKGVDVVHATGSGNMD
ncbi:MAG: OmcA/MtrC family decaheme c-type cytochrome [Thiobacillaceae bacterium]